MMRTITSVLVLLSVYATSADGQERTRVTDESAVQSPAQPASSGTVAIEQAATARKFAFMFFWKERNGATDKAWSVLQSAMPKISEVAMVAAVQVTNPAEKELVARYDLSRTPMPCVMVISPCGAITKALSGEFSEAQLSSAIVSPCTQLCLKAIQDRKLVLLCVLDRQNARERDALPRAAREFKDDARFRAATEVVLLDSGDAGEADFLEQLKVDPRAPRPLTVLLAPPGSVVGTFGAKATKEQFVAQLAAAQANPCAGGKCGPNGCGPKK